MKRLAIFVEGYTEVLFVQRLISEVAGANNIVIEHSQIRGGRKAPRCISVVKAGKQVTHEKYYVLVVDCGGDALVKNANTRRACRAQCEGIQQNYRNERCPTRLYLFGHWKARGWA